MLTTASIFYVLLAGAGFSLMTLVYRLGQQRGVQVQQIALVVTLAGTVYGVACTWPDPFWHAPWLVLGLGAGVGVSQYMILLLLALALRKGPLSPINCAISLGFVLVIFMARLLWHETLSVLQGGGVAGSVLCVIFASFLTRGDRQNDGRLQTARGWLLYAGILVCLFVGNALSNGVFKYLGMSPTGAEASYASLYGNHYLTVLYLTVGLCLGVDILLGAKPRGPLGWQIGLGVVAGLGSISGMGLTRLFASLPASFTFPVVALTVILSGALVSVFCFGEHTSRAWWAMMVSGSIAAGCLIADAWLQI